MAKSIANGSVAVSSPKRKPFVADIVNLKP